MMVEKYPVKTQSENFHLDGFETAGKATDSKVWRGLSAFPEIFLHLIADRASLFLKRSGQIHSINRP